MKRAAITPAVPRIGSPPRLAAITERAMAGRVIGVEREYAIEGRAGAVDARAVLPRLAGLGAALDPGDPNARRGRWGGVVTVDGAEAEVVTPPVPLRPGCTSRVADLAAAGERHLASALASMPASLGLRGYSTHINIEVDDRIVVRVARIVAARLALPLMLALDRATSPGLLVRPRRGRLEIGGEFASGPQLRAAVGIAIGITLLAERATGWGRLGHRWPPTPRPRVVPSVERYGFYIDRRAFGPDLYRTGRATALAVPGGSATAGDLLLAAWDAARGPAGAVLAGSEIDLVDAVVTGAAPIPLEAPEMPADPAPDVAPAPRTYATRGRGAITVTVESATWWRAMLRVASPAGIRWITVPGRALEAVLDEIDSGRLDEELAGILRCSPAAKSPAPR